MGPSLSKPPAEDTTLETFSLVWLDASVNVTEENIRYQAILHSSINQLTTFANSNKCEEFIRSRSANDRIILISSGSLGKMIVPQIHRCRQIFSIYIFCQNRAKHEEWAKKFIKIQGVFTKLSELINQILADQKYQKYKVDQLSISIFNKEHFEKQWMTESTDHFIYSQVLIDCLLQMPITNAEKTTLYNLCRTEYKSNTEELRRIDEFERSYSPERSIWWFTRDSFLYKTLIKALRIQNLDLLFLFRYVIQDIQLQIEKNSELSKIVVYCSQFMSKKELQQLKDSLKQLISINSFLLAIRGRKAGMLILTRCEVSDDMERVLFEIYADGSLSDVKAFIKIQPNSDNNQDEILFSIGSIFQLESISRGEQNVWIVRMTLCTQQDPQLKPIFQEIMREYGDTKTTLKSFGLVLQKMPQFDEAKKYYRRLKTLPSTNTRLLSEYDQTINQISIVEENYYQSIQAMDESIRDHHQNPKMIDRRLAFDHFDRAGEHRQNCNFRRALQSYEKALNIFKNLYNDDHQEVGRCYKHIALTHQENDDYEQALKNYEQAKIILEHHLPSNHPDLSEIYCNIGEMHQNLQKYDQALINYQHALEIVERASTPELSSKVFIMNKIASVYEKQRDFRQALDCYQKIQSLLPLAHVEVEKNQQNISRVRAQLQ